MTNQKNESDELPRHSVSVVGIVIKEGDRILTIRRRDNGHLQPPGGVLELNESFEDGVRREVNEETGAQIYVERLSGVYKNVNAGIVSIAFRCHALTDPVLETPEAIEIIWLDKSDINDLMTPAFAARVLDAFESTPQVRTHDGTNLIE